MSTELCDFFACAYFRNFGHILLKTGKKSDVFLKIGEKTAKFPKKA